MEECRPEKRVYPLHTAVYNDALELVVTLLHFRANVNATDALGQTPLFFCRSKRMVELLENHEADFGVLNVRGQTALHGIV